MARLTLFPMIRVLYFYFNICIKVVVIICYLVYSEYLQIYT